MKDRNEKGLSLLYDQYSASLLGIIVRIVKSRSIGEELLQKTFLKAWNNIEGYDLEKGSLFTWLATIARRTAIDKIRLQGFQDEQKTGPIDQISENLHTVHWEADQIDTNRLLSVLDPNKKTVLDMIYLQGHSHREVAEILDIPLGTVKSRLRLAISALRKELKDEQKLFIGILALYTLLNLGTWI